MTNRRNENDDCFRHCNRIRHRLEEEVKESPKAFYGNANLPADGHERVDSALRAIISLKWRLEALVRGK
ncbi:hypothetical protein IVB27_23545 [Bradyrhizobium sp. 197]|jgi:hypothetical protein|uniref:hypothetical protein n=1 Tax=unclassified Bradyrhizobium TaxID=2631580 RepID=UPI001FF7FC60|nr:hypothetical protein [Bradyrhizobium sp. 197]MCK1477699.1 hypothetical protein [Bradyrhizobium sp. 197]